MSSIFIVVTGSMAIENSSRQRISGLQREGPGQREPLLLAAGELRAQQVEAVLHFVPEHRLAQALLDELVELVRGRACRPGAGRRPRSRRPTAAARPAAERPCPPGGAARRRCACGTRPRRRPAPGRDTSRRRHEVDRAVDALQQRGLARVGRADDAEDLLRAGSSSETSRSAGLRAVADR